MDVVEHGEPDRARPRRGPLVALAAVLALLAVGVVVNVRGSADPEDTGREPTLLGAISIGPETPPPPLETRDPADDDVEPPGWSLPGVREPTGLYLAGSGRGLTVTDLDAGSTDATAFADNGYADARVVGRLGGGWLAFTGADCRRHDTCRDHPLYLVRGGTATKVGEGNDAFPDPDGRTVWVTGRGNTVRWVERRTATGARVGARTLLPAGEEVVGVTSAGPVVSEPYSAEGGATLIRADTRRRSRLGEPGRGYALTAAGHLVLWAGHECAVAEPWTCPVFTVDVRTARRTRVGKGEYRLSGAALDPTGRYVAMVVGIENASVVVVDLARGKETTLPDMEVGMGDAMSWSPDGKWLVLTHQPEETDGVLHGTQVAVWRPGWERAELAATLDRHPRAFVLAYAA